MNKELEQCRLRSEMMQNELKAILSHRTNLQKAITEQAKEIAAIYFAVPVYQRINARNWQNPFYVADWGNFWSWAIES